MQIAASSAKHGKTKLADQLRTLVDEARTQRSLHVGPARPVPIARPARDLAGLLCASYPETRLGDMVLTDELRQAIERVIAEYRARDRLRGHGLAPRAKLLLVGPPGCGKTMTASVLAGECRLPLMTVQLHALITKYMGETAAKLHLIFEAMESTAGVYLFDEFDAIGSTRSTTQDVGEIRRVLNSFLQFLEQHDSDSIVVAATNLLPMLDDALFRRFDAVLHYDLPAPQHVRPLIENRLSAFVTKRLTWKRIVAAAEGLSHAEIVRAAQESAKDAVLADTDTVTTKDLVRALTERTAYRTVAVSSSP
ncbi:ATP-dependent zinc metalloprotease FtsH [Enhygromyxa salina]|uniref:ATP-dependent zinc metalloprotease FtsH n=2 Tax=Enhygromyxa salina TaxID=215803 RepID=A0A2S9YUN3_9BACT|nr:ATP-dependent zinc metalloprotease FtsH [Enhygromyxa salina]